METRSAKRARRAAVDASVREEDDSVRAVVECDDLVALVLSFQAHSVLLTEYMRVCKRFRALLREDPSAWPRKISTSVLPAFSDATRYLGRVWRSAYVWLGSKSFDPTPRDTLRHACAYAFAHVRICVHKVNLMDSIDLPCTQDVEAFVDGDDDCVLLGRLRPTGRLYLGLNDVTDTGVLALAAALQPLKHLQVSIIGRGVSKESFARLCATVRPRTLRIFAVHAGLFDDTQWLRTVIGSLPVEELTIDVNSGDHLVPSDALCTLFDGAAAICASMRTLSTHGFAIDDALAVRLLRLPRLTDVETGRESDVHPSAIALLGPIWIWMRVWH